MKSTSFKGQIIDEIHNIKYILTKISDYIYKNPELGDTEYKAVKVLTSFLKHNNFSIELGIAGRPTSFRATYDSNIEGPTIAFLCEYDALPKMGHGCGHNMIGTMSVGAAVALSKVLNNIGGKLVVFGTPDEERNGAKVDMAEQGIFKGIDVAMIAHPNPVTMSSGKTLAMDALQFEFKGKSSHAAVAPENGINALDGVILTYNGINALRQHISSDVRIHGIITEGGLAANTVPDKAIAKFYIRANKRANLNQVVKKVKNIAAGASLMTGAEVEITNYEYSFDDMNTNETLSESFNINLRQLGIENIITTSESLPSTDMGNVSYVVPSIQPLIGIGNSELNMHTQELADFTTTDIAHEALIMGASALAMTGYDIITDKALLDKIKSEFDECIKYYNLEEDKKYEYHVKTN